MRRVLIAVCLGSLIAGAAPSGCVGSASVTSFRLSARSANGAQTIPIRRLNNLAGGVRLAYQPVDLPADLRKDAKLTVVVIPRSANEQLTVLEPRSASVSTEWTAPFSASIVVLVFAPQGLDEKRLANLVTKDDSLIGSLADYADQTAEVEAGLDLAKQLEQEANDEIRTARPTNPTEQAIYALMRALNPVVSSGNPLGVGRTAGAATLTGKGVEAFFDNAGGVIPGGGILPGVKTWLMPDTEFRSVYAISDETDAVTLCAQIQPKSRNKMAYLWAYRLVNVPGPAMTVAADTHVAAGARAVVPVKLERNADWRLMNRVYDWSLVPASGQGAAQKVAVMPSSDDRALRMDLRTFNGGAGNYRLEAKWDSDVYRPAGTLTIHKLGDLKTTQLAPGSQDRLIAGNGPVAMEFNGPDLLFVDKVGLHREGSVRQIPVDVVMRGDNLLRTEIDTDGLRPGKYLASVSRSDGSVADVPVTILPANPRINNKARVNFGDREQAVTLEGSGLDRLEKIDSEKADITLGAANDEGTRREARVRLKADARAGETLALAAKVTGLGNPLRFPAAMQVAAARPKIREAKASLPGDLPVAVRDGELPAGSWISVALKADPAGTLTLQCAEAARTIQITKLRVGEKQASAQLSGEEDGSLFLSLDPGAIGQSGCTLQAMLEAEATGKSDAFTIGKIVRVPRIESLVLSDEKSGTGFAGTLKGFDLEAIAKTGWDKAAGLNVTELPRPVAGEGAKQTLKVAVPWPSPSPKAPLLIWLRGEAEPRATKVTQ